MFGKSCDFGNEIGECYREVEYRDSKIWQRWCGLGGNWNLRVTFVCLNY